MKPVELDLESIPHRPRKKKEQRGLPTLPRSSAAWRRIVRSIRCDGPQTKNALTKNLRLQAYAVDRIVEFYVKHGIVKRVGRKYMLTEKGADYGKPSPRRTTLPRPKRPTSWSRVTSDDEIIGV